MSPALQVLVLAFCWSSQYALAAPLPSRSHQDPSHEAPKSSSASSVAVSFSCELCKVVSSALEVYLEQEGNEEEVEKVLGEICTLLRIEDKYVCDSMVAVFKAS